MNWLNHLLQNLIFLAGFCHFGYFLALLSKLWSSFGCNSENQRVEGLKICFLTSLTATKTWPKATQNSQKISQIGKKMTKKTDFAKIIQILQLSVHIIVLYGLTWYYTYILTRKSCTVAFLLFWLRNFVFTKVILYKFCGSILTMSMEFDKNFSNWS